MAGVPDFDLRRLDEGPSERAAFLAALRQAARDVGFFTLSGHGISPAQIAETQALARRFFALSLSEKRAVAMIRSPHFRGYTEAGREITRGTPDWREQFDIGAERPALPRRAGDPAWTRLQGPNLWPAGLPELRVGLLRWQEAVTRVGIRVLRAFAEALGQPEDAFEPIYAGAPNQHIKIIRYPGRDGTEGDQGVGAHKDSGLLTLLVQDGQSGLEVEGPEGWISVEPREGRFVVNVGELLELASDGYLRATVHRVVTPPAGRDRLSVAFFLGARHDAVVPLLTLPPSLADKARGPVGDPDNPLFHEVGRNTLKGRLRSHPDVAARHYGDLLPTGAA
ncbi:2-oxobutyrate oxidase [Methylobacterium sp. Leaf102]|uniref:isopenicillin N synthase family dioxygenase n=1 Tax=unclassified Methylobacterium TaxID=2615210 RepID=UPI0007015515|nr:MULTISPECIES: 2-oxoglutarate and iron-dependent oxygenase domain-containing protein [unclassified Methylobacterium]KQO56695.1 2-oxobutyrate oxidase [Methylobacterium sp. Leaf87]KQP32941.1 2-oxobutyrate oxidase [Methylobacterium sp. Leaf102]KQP70844.1 2-oxobutyrate oxidase [Methylobacterium sp. Leaf112]